MSHSWIRLLTDIASDAFGEVRGIRESISAETMPPFDFGKCLKYLKVVVFQKKHACTFYLPFKIEPLPFTQTCVGGK